jgi:uncharacterized protein (TIGR02145 family)
MRRIALLIFVFFTLTKIQSQDYMIGFAGAGAGTIVDSVKVENLTQCKSKSIGGSGTLHLLGTIGIKETSKNVENNIRVYPLPMIDKCSIEFETAASTKATIEIYDITGRRIIKERTRLQSGIHLYSISGLSSGIYFLRVNSNTFSHTAKIVCINSHKSSFSINYTGSIAFGKNHGSVSNKGSMNDSRENREIIEMQYTAGDRLKFTGFSGGIYRTIFILVPVNSQTITFNFVNCTDADSNHYSVVQIGTQLWMVENLRTTKYRNNDNIPNITSNTAWNSLSTSAYCNYQNTTNPDTINTYGRLYNWFSVNDSRNIAPAGWHIASDSAWLALANYLGGAANAGGKLKEYCSGIWRYPNTGATNETGFTAIPGGYRLFNGTFDELGGWSIWWTSTNAASGTAYNRVVFYNQYVLDSEPSDKRDGFAVRCLKD